MTNNGLPTVFRAINDPEGAQYQLLARKQLAMDAFAKNIVYPHLAEMVGMYNTLVGLTDQIDRLRTDARGVLKGIDLSEGALMYDKTAFTGGEILAIESFVEWALPHIRTAIDEGRTVFEFVDEHMKVAEVGVVPTYQEEGYLLIPNSLQETLHVVKYELSVYTSLSENYRSLKTRVVREIPFGAVAPPPATIKMQLVEENSDLPNPATFLAVTDIEFPFAGTVLPIAKRKLMERLSSSAG